MDTRDLLAIPNWVTWRTERGTKVPYSVSGKRAKSNDPSTWASYDEACRVSPQVGFVLPLDGSLTVLDLDNAIQDGCVIRRYRKLLSLVDWAEVSPSGKGIHVLIAGSKPAGLRSRFDFPESRMEVYDRGRYITYTGDMLPGMSGEIVNGDNVFIELLHHQASTGKPSRGSRSYKVSAPKEPTHVRWERNKRLRAFHAELRERLKEF